MHHDSLIMFMCAFVHTWTIIYKAISDCKLPGVLSSQKPAKVHIFLTLRLLMSYIYMTLVA
jgi:hypothetical protein